MRNKFVEEAVNQLLGLVDRLSQGKSLGAPTPKQIKDIFDTHVERKGGSIKLASAFFVSYCIEDRNWDFQSVPTGIRGKYGDKLLATQLTRRNVTFHNNITAFGENLGWKGSVRNFNLTTDQRFSEFLSQLQKLNDSQKSLLLNHVAWVLESSRVIPKALPPLPSDYLSYARSLTLCEQLIAVPSEGHIQQFLVAAFLEIHRGRFGNRVITHHPHASDKYDGTYGDIEEYRDGELVSAYEVTVRDDWKNRLEDFAQKSLNARLAKYILFASNVRNDRELYPASSLLNFVGGLTFDLAVVDISDFFCVFCAELSKDEIRLSINRAYELLIDPALCGREDFISKFSEITDSWMGQ